MNKRWRAIGPFCGIAILVFAVIVFFAAPAGAQGSKKPDFPTKPIRIIVYDAAGGNADTETRAMQPHLQKELGVSFVVENITGGGGKIGATQAYKAKPDGYTLMTDLEPKTVIGEVVFGGVYKTANFTSIYSWSVVDYLLMVKKDSPYNDLKSFFQAMKSSSRRFANGSSGVGSSSHLQSAVMRAELGLNYIDVPFDGTAPQMTALMGGNVDFVVSPASQAYKNASYIKVLGSITEKRVAPFPQVPTFAEQGFKATPMLLVRGMLAPPGLPEDRQKILEEAFARVTAKPEFKDWAKKMAVNLRPTSGKEYHEYLKQTVEMVKQYKEILVVK
jgi:tripartite-type tricarboxylate transporter receptor subunit TctC